MLCLPSRFHAVLHKHGHKKELSPSHKVRRTVNLRKTDERWQCCDPVTQAGILQAAPAQTLSGFRKDLIVFAQLYKGTCHSHDTFPHILYNTQLIHFYHMGPYTEIKGHIKVLLSQLKTQESPLLPPPNPLFVISSCLHWGGHQWVKRLGYLCTTRSTACSGVTLFL